MDKVRNTFRHELKFYINEYEYHMLRQKAKSVLKSDKNAVSEKGYHIRSLYFDNVYDTDLFEKNYGILQRKKFRIRIYNLSDSVIRLERKNRYGEYINKQSAPITRSEYEKILNWDYQFLLEKGNSVCKDFYLHLRTEHMEPRVIVDYIREAYIGDVSQVRITFDKNLSAAVDSTSIFDSNIVTQEALNSKVMIMEVKFNEFLPSHYRSLLNLDSYSRSAISKYVICRETRMNYFK